MSIEFDEDLLGIWFVSVPRGESFLIQLMQRCREEGQDVPNEGNDH